MDKRMFKKTGEELQEYLRIMCKHHVVPSKKGKGSYKRKAKHKKRLSRLNGAMVELEHKANLPVTKSRQLFFLQTTHFCTIQ